MRRYTRYATFMLLIAASAWLGWHSLARAEKTTAGTRLVQMEPNPTTARQPQTMMQSSGPQLPQGVTQKDLGAGGDVRDTFATFAKDALKKDNFKRFADNFVDADRDRLTRGGDQNMDTWNKAVDDFDQAWKSRYNASFEVGDKDKAYSDRFFAISTGQATNPQQITHWPMPPTSKNSAVYQQVTANPTIKNNTDIAVVTLQSTGGADDQPIQCSLLREGRSWKIDIPDSVTADDIRESVARHLNTLTSMKDKWPSDSNEAARVVTYHLLQACYTAGQLGSEGGAGSISGSSATDDKTTEGNTTDTDNDNDEPDVE